MNHFICSFGAPWVYVAACSPKGANASADHGTERCRNTCFVCKSRVLFCCCSWVTEHCFFVGIMPHSSGTVASHSGVRSFRTSSGVSFAHRLCSVHCRFWNGSSLLKNPPFFFFLNCWHVWFRVRVWVWLGLSELGFFLIHNLCLCLEGISHKTHFLFRVQLARTPREQEAPDEHAGEVQSAWRAEQHLQLGGCWHWLHVQAFTGTYYSQGT